MAFAAGLGDSRPLYTDTRSRPDVLAHPLFPVCFEWPAFLSTRHLPVGERLTSEERVRGVHASHDLVLHKPLRAGMQLETRACISRVERRPSGAFPTTSVKVPPRSIQNSHAPMIPPRIPFPFVARRRAGCNS